MQVIVNINPNRQEHTNKRDDGHVLPRDHDQEPKKSFVGWDQEYSSSTTIDQGKSNIMGSEMKSMRKPGEESLVVRQEYLSDNVVERDTRPKPVVGNPTGYDYFLSSKRECSTTGVLGGGDFNQDDLLSTEKKKGGRSTPKNVVDGVARTSSPLEEEKKEAAPFFVDEKNIAVPIFSSTNIEARGNKTSTTTGSYAKGDQPKKGERNIT